MSGFFPDFGPTATVSNRKKYVRVATTAALAANTRTGNTLTADANGALASIDGVSLAVGERILVKNEGTGANNGIYEVTGLGSGSTKWTFVRASDSNSSDLVKPGDITFVSEGTTNGNTLWQLTTDDTITLNTTSLTFALAVPAGGAAPNNAQYVVLATHADLTVERVLTGTANQITVTDGGAGGNVTLSVPQDIATTSSPTFANLTLGSGGDLLSVDEVVFADAAASASAAGRLRRNGTNLEYHDGTASRAVYRASGTDVAVADGGTGASDAATARTNLGLAIGTDVQAYDAQLADIAGISFVQGDIMYFNGTNVVRLAPGTAGTVLKSQGSSANPIWDRAFSVNDATNNNVSTVLTLTHTTSGTAAAGIGTSLLFQAEDSGGGTESVARIDGVLSNATDTTEGGELQFWTRTGGGALAKRLTVQPDGTLNFETGIDIAGLDACGFADAAAGAGSAGQLRRNGTNLEYHDGTASRVIYKQSGTDVAVADGGTGASDAATARTNLGLAIGTNVQAWDADLDAIAALASAADKLPYATGAQTWALADFTAAGRALVDDANAAAQRTTLGLAIGTDVQAYHARLADVAGATYAQGNVIYYNGTNLVVLAPGTSGQFLKTQGAGANPVWASSTGSSLGPVLGDASDGSVAFDGTNTFGFASTTGSAPNLVYTLTRDVFASSVTVSSGKTVNSKGFKLHCTGTLTNAGTIQHNGDNGSGTTAGAGASGGTLIGDGTNGGAGRSTTGNGTQAATTSSSFGGDSGAGGNSTGQTGAAGRTATDPVAQSGSIRSLFPFVTGRLITSGNALATVDGGAGGGGGSATLNAGTASSGGGGGGGGGIWIACKTLDNTGGTIQAQGGDGAAGAATGNGEAGGGGGGGGGYVWILVTDSTTAAGTIQAGGGSGGAGAGAGGTAGAAGSAGTVVRLSP